MECYGQADRHYPSTRPCHKGGESDFEVCIHLVQDSISLVAEL